MVVDELSAGFPSIFGARMGGKGKKKSRRSRGRNGKNAQGGETQKVHCKSVLEAGLEPAQPLLAKGV